MMMIMHAYNICIYIYNMWDKGLLSYALKDKLLTFSELGFDGIFKVDDLVFDELGDSLL